MTDDTTKREYLRERERQGGGSEAKRFHDRCWRCRGRDHMKMKNKSVLRCMSGKICEEHRQGKEVVRDGSI